MELHQPTDCVAFYGHGDRDNLLAQPDPSGVTLVDAANASLLVGKLIYVVACDSGASLGPWIVSQGAEAYLGYDDLLGIVWGGPEVWFRDGANSALMYLIAPQIGGAATCDAAVQEARRVYTAGIEFYIRGAGQGHPNYALAAA